MSAVSVLDRKAATAVAAPARERLLFVTAIAAFFSAYLVAYRFEASRLFGYYGLGFDSQLPFEYWLLIATLALVPATLIPTRFDRPSDFLLLVIYCVVYLPALVLAFHGNLPVLERTTAVQLVLSLFAGLMIMVLLRRSVPAVALPRFAIPPWAFWLGFSAACATCAAYIAAVLGSLATFVDLSEVYKLRTEASDEILQTGSKFGMVWLEASLVDLFQRGLISLEEVMTKAKGLNKRCNKMMKNLAK